MKEDVIHTAWFTVPVSRLARRQMSAWLWRRWWVLTLPVACAAVAGCYDWRWWVAALALLLVLYPGVMAIGFYRCALSPDAVGAVVPHRVEIGPDGISVHYEPPRSGLSCHIGSVRRASDDDGFFVIEIDAPGECHIDIPYSSLREKDDITALRRMLAPFFDKY